MSDGIQDSYLGKLNPDSSLSPVLSTICPDWLTLFHMKKIQIHAVQYGSHVWVLTFKLELINLNKIKISALHHTTHLPCAPQTQVASGQHIEWCRYGTCLPSQLISWRVLIQITQILTWIFLYSELSVCVDMGKVKQVEHL